MDVVFDKAGAMERVGEDIALLCDLVRLCHEQCDARLMVLMHEVRHKDFAAVKKTAHFLKGSLGNVGAVAAQRAAQAIEEAALAENVERVEALADELLDKINEFFLVFSAEFGRESD